ncbi:MAG: amidohydrolase family protein [Saprospiraceae bacterium]|nr:amidohydrolase family protein [Saprospiraceae bacterium]
MRYICISLIFISSVLILSGQSTILHCGQLIDMTNELVQSEMTIVIQSDSIVSITPGYTEAGEEDKVIDLRTKTVLPGFMDMHVHIEHESSPSRYLDKFRKNKSDMALDAVKFCKRTLMAGFTTVRDLGGTGVNVSLRDAIQEGDIIGPRIFTAEKSIATTGGHADPTNGVKYELKGDPGPKEGVINSAEDAYKAFRQRYKMGADCIKITATGGVLSVAKDGQGPQFTVNEVKAVVDAANDYNFVTAAHAHGAEGMKRAVLGGIHSIEHGTKMTPEVMDLMIERGTYYVPTISAGRFVAEKAKQPGYYPAIIVPKALEIGPKIQETFSKAHKAGVKIAFGTDAGVSPHGDNALEFIYMTEGGMSNFDALKTATVNAAELMRISDDHGTIEKGKTADIIALDSNPLEDINAVMQVAFVMKSGHIYKMKK